MTFLDPFRNPARWAVANGTRMFREADDCWERYAEEAPTAQVERLRAECESLSLELGRVELAAEDLRYRLSDALQYRGWQFQQIVESIVESRFNIYRASVDGGEGGMSYELSRQRADGLRQLMEQPIWKRVASVLEFSEELLWYTLCAVAPGGLTLSLPARVKPNPDGTKSAIQPQTIRIRPGVTAPRVEVHAPDSAGTIATTVGQRRVLT